MPCTPALARRWLTGLSRGRSYPYSTAHTVTACTLPVARGAVQAGVLYRTSTGTCQRDAAQAALGIVLWRLSTLAVLSMLTSSRSLVASRANAFRSPSCCICNPPCAIIRLPAMPRPFCAQQFRSVQLQSHGRRTCPASQAFLNSGRVRALGVCVCVRRACAKRGSGRWAG